MPGDDLSTHITLSYAISRDYVPQDLVSLGDYLPHRVTQGYPTQFRAVAAEPLTRMITDMQALGMAPTLISGYRSYSTQALAYQKWLAKHPDRVNALSSPPGHSEHQLGTAVDFGSPELAGIVGDADIEFHTYFYKTSEGSWLAENAHKYGFTLSYSRADFELTGFFYEPWHFRYVGTEMATELFDLGVSLTSYQLANAPIPCLQ